MADDDTQRYHCSYCGCDITLRLKCAVCPDFDLCLQCFAAGAVAGPHKRDHSYQLIDEGSFPLLVDDWGAIEEVLLLDAVEHDGFGNWEDIAAHVVTKTARESRDHYGDTYINGVIGEGTIPARHHASILDGRGGEAPPCPPSYTPVKLEHVEQVELGYMPLRDDFEREYENSLEEVISEVTVGADEEEIERELKLAHIDIYNKGLTEREKRKSIAKQHGLIAGKQKLSAMKRKSTKEEKRLRDKFKTVGRLLEAEEYEQLLTSIKSEWL
jgi:transcriptional adapter 2-beta